MLTKRKLYGKMKSIFYTYSLSIPFEKANILICVEPPNKQFIFTLDLFNHIKSLYSVILFVPNKDNIDMKIWCEKYNIIYLYNCGYTFDNILFIENANNNHMITDDYSGLKTIVINSYIKPDYYTIKYDSRIISDLIHVI